MGKQHKSMLVLAVMAAFMATVLFLPGLIGAGELEPSGPPGPTMKTLQDIYDKLDAIAREVFEIKTGYPAHCYQLRFCDMGDGTVLDTETGLIWLKNANCFGTEYWNGAKSEAASLADGQCGLTDGSVAGDWRLPTKEELQGIGTYPPTTWYSFGPTVTWTKPGSPFENVASGSNPYYWSSTASGSVGAWYVRIDNGSTLTATGTTNLMYVWPVREY